MEPERFDEVFNRGWDTAVRRIDQDYITQTLGTRLPSPEEIEHFREHFRSDVHSTIEKAEAPLQPHFVEFFVESASVSHIARQLHESDPLTQDELQSYLAHSVEFFNDWTSNFH